jgi:GNAT superfamily N-acetyltransferase
MAPTPAFTRRPEGPGDALFLLQLMTDVIAAELGVGAWPEAIRNHLLGIQAQSRCNSRRAVNPNSHSKILQCGGVDIGWMLTTTGDDFLWLVEIAVVPEFQGRGIGSAAIRELIARGKPVRLHVNSTNTRAIALYATLGFVPLESGEVQILMECPCTQA